MSQMGVSRPRQRYTLPAYFRFPPFGDQARAAAENVAKGQNRTGAAQRAACEDSLFSDRIPS